MSEKDIRTIEHTASKSSIKVHPYGATVLSYVAKEREHLFVSKTAILKGNKPIRGGIPLVFPIFGPPPSDSESTMPQHGFARRSVWSVVEEYDHEDFAGIVLELNYNKETVTDGVGENNAWADDEGINCALRLSVDFNDIVMITKLHILNNGQVAYPIQALLHTYYKVDNNAALNAKECYVDGLEGYSITDKVADTSGEIADKTPVSISGEIDRVYTPTSTNERLEVEIGVGGGKSVHMTATGTITDTTSSDKCQKEIPVSCVIWNPHLEKAKEMRDFATEQYEEMICVEPGILNTDTNKLEPGHQATLTQFMSSFH